MTYIPSQKSSGHRARKRFGQNFLVSQGVIKSIMSTVNPHTEDQFVEIGPGLGVLTQKLIDADVNLTAIELDRDLAARIEQLVAAKPNCTVLCSDALTVSYDELVEYSDDENKANKLRVIGNLPYNISTPLIFHLLHFSDCISDMHFMLQKEVVDRICASPGTTNYGRLSVMVQYHCDAEPLIAVPPDSFDPPPKVDSAVLRLTPKNTNSMRRAINVDDLQLIVRSAFNNRRKTLRNSLKNELDYDDIANLDIDPGARPETLSLDQFIDLANAYTQNAE